MTRPHVTKFAALALAAFLALGVSASAAQKLGSKASEESVVAHVGDMPITLDAFHAFIQQLPANMQAQADANKAAFLEALIQRMLMLRHADESNFLGAERVKMQIERARREILIGEALRRIEEGARPKASDIRAEYERNKAKYTEGGKLAAPVHRVTWICCAAHIMVSSEKEAKDLLAKIVKGEDFAELAKKYSLAPERALGGSLGEMSRGHSKRTGLPEIIEQTAFALDPGAHSGVVQSIYGWHVVKTSKKEGAKQLDFSEVAEKITREMGERNRQEAMRQKFIELTERYEVKRYLENLK